MTYPDNIIYSKDHIWLKPNGDYFILGITDFAQDLLGDIVYVEINKNSEDKVAGINWTNTPDKASGIYFGHNREECEKLNWENKIEKMNKLFHLWGKRNLTLIGKILIIKTLVLPLFTFLASACTVPEKFRKEIESKCYKYI